MIVGNDGIIANASTANDFVCQGCDISVMTMLALLQKALCKKASNHHANLPLEMYSFTL